MDMLLYGQALLFMCQLFPFLQLWTSRENHGIWWAWQVNKYLLTHLPFKDTTWDSRWGLWWDRRNNFLTSSSHMFFELLLFMVPWLGTSLHSVTFLRLADSSLEVNHHKDLHTCDLHYGFIQFPRLIFMETFWWAISISVSNGKSKAKQNWPWRRLVHVLLPTFTAVPKR